MSDILRIVLQLMGAFGGVCAFFLAVVWHQRQKLEDLDHAAIKNELLTQRQAHDVEFKDLKDRARSELNAIKDRNEADTRNMRDRMEVFEKEFNTIIGLQQGNALRLGLAEQNFTYLKETMNDLKLAVADLKEIVVELSKTVAVIASREN